MSPRLTLDDVVRVDVEPADFEPAQRRHPIASGMPSRRAVLKTGVVAAASLLTLRVARIVPMDRAGATHAGTQGYQIQGDCTGDSWYNDSNESCNVPCGGSTIEPSSCETSGHLAQWHKNNGTGFGQFTLRPDECNAGTDGWKWNHKFCSPCFPNFNTTHFRCHDGFKHYGGSPPPLSTICKVALSCLNT